MPSERDPAMRTRERRLLAWVLAVGAVACLAAFFQFRGSKLAGDQTYYLYVTESILKGLGHESALRPPLYPYSWRRSPSSHRITSTWCGLRRFP